MGGWCGGGKIIIKFGVAMSARGNIQRECLAEENWQFSHRQVKLWQNPAWLLSLFMSQSRHC